MDTTLLGFTTPAWLWGLCLAALPWWPATLLPLTERSFSSLRLLPVDRASVWAGRAVRALASLAIAALFLALAEPYRPSYQVEREGRGAEIVIVLDRSRSMDQSQLNSTGPMAGYSMNYSVAARHSDEERLTKAQIARRALSAFASHRPNDRFAMVLFSTQPLQVLDFTEKPAAIQAAIDAGAVGRGIANTDIGQALLSGLSLFEHRAYTGSRVLMLVSDGGDHIESDMRERLTRLFRQYRVSLDWIYLRSPLSPSLEAEPGSAPDAADTVPELFLNRYFHTLPTPYRSYEASNPAALQHAIDDIDRLENLPITTVDTVPRRSLAAWCLWLAAGAVGLLILAGQRELRTWA